MDVLLLFEAAEFEDPFTVILPLCTSGQLNLLARLNRRWRARAEPLLEARLKRGLRWLVPFDPYHHEFKWIGMHTAGASYVRGTSIYFRPEAGEIWDIGRTYWDSWKNIRCFASLPHLACDDATPWEKIQPKTYAFSWWPFARRTERPTAFGAGLSNARRWWGDLTWPPYKDEDAPEIEVPEASRLRAFRAGTYPGTVLIDTVGSPTYYLIDDLDAMSDELERAAFIAERAGVVFTWV